MTILLIILALLVFSEVLAANKRGRKEFERDNPTVRDPFEIKQ